MPQRASVDDAEALEADAVPPEVDTMVIGLTLGQEGLTQSLEADIGVFVGQIGAGSCWSVYPGFQPNICFRVERYYCRNYSLLGELVLAPKLYSETA